MVRARPRRRCDRSLVIGLSLATVGLYGLLRMPDLPRQLHAAGLITGPARSPSCSPRSPPTALKSSRAPSWSSSSCSSRRRSRATPSRARHTSARQASPTTATRTPSRTDADRVPLTFTGGRAPAASFDDHRGQRWKSLRTVDIAPPDAELHSALPVCTAPRARRPRESAGLAVSRPKRRARR